MARTTVKLDGFKELRDRARKLDGKMQRKVYSKAVRAGGKIVVDAAKAKVPVKTGAVKASLVHRASSKPREGLFGVKVTIKPGRKGSERTARRRSGKGAVYFPDAVERYYRFTELGTKHHPARPYLAPALEGSRAAVLNAVKAELAAGLEREAAAL
jgi:HK97 gp10 family phage protein